MIYTKLTKKAMILAFEKHKNQLDKSNIPYMYHIFNVAKDMDDEVTTCVALLHDIIEDTDITLNDLSNLGFYEEIIEAIKCMSHPSHLSEEEYLNYIKEIKDNKIARKVKLADLKHNSLLSRFDTITDKDIDRYNKYQKAIAILEGK